jgi:hypothetical protein
LKFRFQDQLSQKLQYIRPKEHLAGWSSAQRAAHAAFEEKLVDLCVGLCHWEISLKILMDGKDRKFLDCVSSFLFPLKIAFQ